MSTTVYTYVSGWNAGATTIGKIAKDGCFTFYVPKTTIGAVCGLTSKSVSGSQSEIEYAFQIDKGRYRIIEKGIVKTNYASFPYTLTRFKVERVNSKIYYYVENGEICSETGGSDLWENKLGTIEQCLYTESIE